MSGQGNPNPKFNLAISLHSNTFNSRFDLLTLLTRNKFISFQIVWQFLRFDRVVVWQFISFHSLNNFRQFISNLRGFPNQPIWIYSIAFNSRQSFQIWEHILISRSKFIPNFFPPIPTQLIHVFDFLIPLTRNKFISFQIGCH